MSKDSTTKRKLQSLWKDLLNEEKKKFDETFFDFNLKGGPNHTDLIMAEAIIREGQKQG